MTPKQQALIAFAEAVLAILEDQEDWSPSTLDDIASAAVDQDLASINEDGQLFTRNLYHEQQKPTPPHPATDSEAG